MRQWRATHHLPEAAIAPSRQAVVRAHPQLPVLARRQRPDQRLIQPFGHTVAACPATPQTPHALGPAADPQLSFPIRSEERRVGTEWVSECRYRGAAAR